MGCLKLYQDREGLEKSSVFFRETLGKKGGQEKNRVNYYPFGFVMNSYTSNGEKYRFGYQGDFAEDDTEETGFNHFEARQYDPRIGRWMVVDPYRQFASPYIGMGNNPINGVDPDGAYLFGLFGSSRSQRQDARQMAQADGIGYSCITCKEIRMSYEQDWKSGPNNISFKETWWYTLNGDSELNYTATTAWGTGGGANLAFTIEDYLEVALVEYSGQVELRL